MDLPNRDSDNSFNRQVGAPLLVPLFERTSNQGLLVKNDGRALVSRHWSETWPPDDEVNGGAVRCLNARNPPSMKEWFLEMI